MPRAIGAWTADDCEVRPFAVESINWFDTFRSPRGRIAGMSGRRSRGPGARGRDEFRRRRVACLPAPYARATGRIRDRTALRRLQLLRAQAPVRAMSDGIHWTNTEGLCGVGAGWGR